MGAVADIGEELIFPVSLLTLKSTVTGTDHLPSLPATRFEIQQQLANL